MYFTIAKPYVLSLLTKEKCQDGIKSIHATQLHCLGIHSGAPVGHFHKRYAPIQQRGFIYRSHSCIKLV